MKNIRISAKLGLAFGVITLLTVLLSFIAWRQMLAMNSSTEDIATNWLPSVQALGEMRIAANRARRSESMVFLPDASVADDRYRKELQERVAGLEKSQLAYEPLVTPGEEQRLFNQFKAQKQRYLQIQKSMLGLPSDSFVAARGQFLGDSEQAFDEMANSLGELAAFNRSHSDMAQKDAEHVFIQAEATLLVISLGVVGIAVALAFWISKIITKPLRQAVEIAEGVSAGNLAMDITADGSDEPAQLMKALAHMRSSLASVVSDVRENAEGVATASAEIAQGNNDLSSRTEQQASALEETAASMEELSSTVRNNADSAQRANELAGTASQVAKRSGETVEAMVATMKTIDAASKSIGEIIGVIDSIAFQTNILALNAAVEAARAGEQGRGFAVVATEVRSLAKRSADAAKQIKDLIATSEARVADGSAQADRAGLSMREVVTSIESVAAIVEEISIATREQSAGISQVGEAVTQMDQVTQQNAALVEQSAAAASSLSEQAERLVASVAVFRVSGMADNEAISAQAARDIIARVSGQPNKQLLTATKAPGAKTTISKKLPQSTVSVINTTKDDWASF